MINTFNNSIDNAVFVAALSTVEYRSPKPTLIFRYGTVKDFWFYWVQFVGFLLGYLGT